MGDGASHETERTREDQPERDDLIDPELVDPELVEPDEVDEDHDEHAFRDEDERPSSEELPESQGADIVEASRLTEDAAARPRLDDEAP
jgi:hypothetical protein